MWELRRSCANRSEKFRTSYFTLERIRRYFRKNWLAQLVELKKKKALTRDACHSDSGHVLVSIERAVAQIVDLILPAVRALSSGSKLYANA